MKTAIVLSLASWLGTATAVSTTVVTLTNTVYFCPTPTGLGVGAGASGTLWSTATACVACATGGSSPSNTNFSTSTSSSVSSPSSTTTSCPAEATPTVDLKYTIHQATINETGGYFNFSNIRYGEAPVGDLRWRPSIPPQSINRVVDDGSINRICPQAGPAWESDAGQFITTYLTGGNISNFLAQLTLPQVTSAPAPDPSVTEDCLFLDVLVPDDIYNSKCNNEEDGTGGAPVLVWIYGGGYTGGSKTGSGNPAGLLARSQDDGNRGLVYVALNYRLGAFGFLSGEDLEADGVANAGLYDQRLALEWIQQNIHLFGGDPKKVTVMGESAGAGSIMHQITAYGGTKGPAPFHQAIAQSPGFQPSLSNNTQLQEFLAAAGVSTVAEARNLDTTTLQTANYLQVANSPWGSFTYGPVVDGVFAPELPGVALLNGHYDKSVVVMAGHNADEGLLFTSPFIQSDATFNEYVTTSFPDIKPEIASYVEDILYPAVFTGANGYEDETGRASLTVAEAAFTCNTNYLAHAYNNQTYNYYFTNFPALHGEDVGYTFYNGQALDGYGFPINVPIATLLQGYLIDFALTGTPNADLGVPFFPVYGFNSTVLDLTTTPFPFPDPVANPRCTWWQQGLFL